MVESELSAEQHFDEANELMMNDQFDLALEVNSLYTVFKIIFILHIFKRIMTWLLKNVIKITQISYIRILLDVLKRTSN